ncbi:MAG: tRNA pseudouridine(38-40) synthase TruA [Gammaproteobacteria bacterium]
MRIALGVEYDGSRFHGWQRQRDERTVQAELERALTRVADEPVDVVCAGRTDTGVHATGQVVHFDTGAHRSERSWVLGSNVNLPGDVAVVWARPVPDDFHARFSARSRTYVYLISTRQARPGLWSGRVSWECRPLELARMQAAATALVGEHDFSSFRAKGCQAHSPVRTIHRLELTERDGLITLTVEANAFLQHMVRNLAGVLMEIGRGRRVPAWAAEVLAARERERGGVTAPPSGLYLAAVRYAEEFGLPAAAGAAPALAAYAGAAFRS